MDSTAQDHAAQDHAADGPNRSGANMVPPGFATRHIGPREAELAAMLAAVRAPSLQAFIEDTVPAVIRAERPLRLPAALSEVEAIERLATYASENTLRRSLLGYGYHHTITPPVILRNVLENPGWYTAYTPYQAEISQGRLEALLLFQTMVQDLTGMDISNASLLDEATAAAEAMTMVQRLGKGDASRLLVSRSVHPQTRALLQTRAAPLDIELVDVDDAELDAGTTSLDGVFGALVQYPGTDGVVRDPSALAERLHAVGGMLIVSTDLLALTLLKPPGELGADIVVGNSQRFGVPLGYGGPHAGFLATRDAHKRQMPGRIIGISRDRRGQRALRMALQTREQHIRRQKATSNICTAQVLLSVTAAMYGVWHGPEGLRALAERLAGLAAGLRHAAGSAGWTAASALHFDTVCLRAPSASARDAAVVAAEASGFNLRAEGADQLIIALDEASDAAELGRLCAALGWTFAGSAAPDRGAMARTSAFMTHRSFHEHRSETQMLRFLAKLQRKDIALDTSMIPLGSCTMKLNSTTEMIPVTWKGFGALHPFIPTSQAKGYRRLFDDLEAWLAEITGFDAVSLQPNAGSQGEYAGLLCIRGYHLHRGDAHRRLCLIPTSAHGTNPASAVMAGMEVIPVACDDQGNVDLADLRKQVERCGDKLAGLMVTYPSTHGVFEESIREICALVHAAGGQVYMDGANMNALVGLARPAELGADVLHLNLHKTFCIPHGGGGPGMGPIGVRAHLAPFLPGHNLVDTGQGAGMTPVSAAPWGSPSILPISWAYIAMMSGEGLTRATEIAILNANYVAERLRAHYPVLYTGKTGRVAHECILDLRHFKKIGIEAEDVAKRLMDYSFHAPTLSWPVAGTLMVEPTESEDKAELDRFCDAMIAIRGEIAAVEEGRIEAAASPLKFAPHTAEEVAGDTWDRAYTRSEAAWPLPYLREQKYWPPVSRVDNTWGDRNVFCSCNAWDDVDTSRG
ncbi:MAG: hypothetical protein RL071_2029 [Pseudomonadota bacterium]